MKQQPQCHKCPFNGQHHDECLKCEYQEQYDFRYNHYILDGYDVPDPKSQIENDETQATVEDEKSERMKQFLMLLFDLSPTELLTLKFIMN